MYCIKHDLCANAVGSKKVRKKAAPFTLNLKPLLNLNIILMNLQALQTSNKVATLPEYHSGDFTPFKKEALSLKEIKVLHGPKKEEFVIEQQDNLIELYNKVRFGIFKVRS